MAENVLFVWRPRSSIIFLVISNACESNLVEILSTKALLMRCIICWLHNILWTNKQMMFCQFDWYMEIWGKFVHENSSWHWQRFFFSMLSSLIAKSTALITSSGQQMKNSFTTIAGNNISPSWYLPACRCWFTVNVLWYFCF